MNDSACNTRRCDASPSVTTLTSNGSDFVVTQGASTAAASENGGSETKQEETAATASSGDGSAALFTVFSASIAMAASSTP